MVLQSDGYEHECEAYRIAVLLTIQRGTDPIKSPAARATGLVTKTSRKETVRPGGADCQTVTGTSPKESPRRNWTDGRGFLGRLRGADNPAGPIQVYTPVSDSPKEKPRPEPGLVKYLRVYV